MQKQLIHFDQTAYERHMVKWPPIIKALNELVAEINRLGIECTPKLFKQILTDGIKPLREKYVSAIEKDISKFRSEGLRNNLLSFTQGDLARISEKYEKILEVVSQQERTAYITTPVHLTDASIEDGQVVLTEESIEVIKERHRIYIETEREQETYNLMMALRDAWNNLRDHINKYHENGPFMSLLHNGFIEVDLDERASIVPEAIKCLRENPVR
jgi:hypothetical protein